MPQSSYYDKQNKPTAALYRARQPYLVKNIGTGLVLLGFVGAVCTYNLHWIIQASGRLIACDRHIHHQGYRPGRLQRRTHARRTHTDRSDRWQHPKCGSGQPEEIIGCYSRKLARCKITSRCIWAAFGELVGNSPNSYKGFVNIPEARPRKNLVCTNCTSTQ